MFKFPPTKLPVALNVVPVITLAPEMLPLGPVVVTLPAITLPVALTVVAVTKPEVFKLPPVTLPIALVSPGVYKLPPVMLVVTFKSLITLPDKLN